MSAGGSCAHFGSRSWFDSPHPRRSTTRASGSTKGASASRMVSALASATPMLRRSRRHCGSTLRRRGRRRSSTSRTAKAPTARPPLSHFSFRAAPFGLLGHFNSGVEARSDRPCWLHGAFKVAEIVPKRLERVTLTTDLRGGAHPPLAEKGDGRAPALKRVLKQEPSRGP